MLTLPPSKWARAPPGNLKTILGCSFAFAFERNNLGCARWASLREGPKTRTTAAIKRERITRSAQCCRPARRPRERVLPGKTACPMVQDIMGSSLVDGIRAVHRKAAGQDLSTACGHRIRPQPQGLCDLHPSHKVRAAHRAHGPDDGLTDQRRCRNHVFVAPGALQCNTCQRAEASVAGATQVPLVVLGAVVGGTPNQLLQSTPARL